jgi:hypothetical protein
MKHLTKIVFAALLAIGGLQLTTSCTDYQDEIDSLDKRVTALEELVNRLNQNIKGISDLLNATENGWVITGIVEVSPKDDPKGIGYYTITFGKMDPKTGKLSEKSEDKKAITIYNGEDGTDAPKPEIKVKKGDDGYYYWYVGDNPVLDPDTNLPVPANGKDGEPGKDGKSTATTLDINDDGYWIVVYGDSWDYIYGPDGKPVSATGKPGKDAEPIIKGVTIRVDTSGNRYAEFDLGGGQIVVVPLVD